MLLTIPLSPAAGKGLAQPINRCRFLYLVLAWLKTQTLPVLSYLTPPKKKKKKRLAFACRLDGVPGQDLANPGCRSSHVMHIPDQPVTIR